LALDLAEALDRPVLLDVCSMAQAKAAAKVGAHRGPGVAVAGYVAPCRPIADALGRRVDTGLVSVVPVGVAAPAQPREIADDPRRDVALAVIGGARDLPAYDALFVALSRLLHDDSDIQVMLELSGPYEHEIWMRAERLGLLRSISALASASSYRPLLTRCDLLLLPEREGELRSIMLEAMAVGVPIIAAHNPVCDVLVDRETAFVVNGVDSGSWTDAIRQALTEPAQTKSIAQRAREAVIASNRSTEQMTKLIQTLERTLSGGSYPFRTPPA
jgi:glycosyltransferase involved in cell wall biosynthesis